MVIIDRIERHFRLIHLLCCCALSFFRHPDKSNSPEAENKFVEIKQAYELLSDSDRRRNYDLHGITNEDAHIYKDRPDYSQYGRFSFDPFEEFFG